MCLCSEALCGYVENHSATHQLGRPLRTHEPWRRRRGETQRSRRRIELHFLKFESQSNASLPNAILSHPISPPHPALSLCPSHLLLILPTSSPHHSCPYPSILVPCFIAQSYVPHHPITACLIPPSQPTSLSHPTYVPTPSSVPQFPHTSLSYPTSPPNPSYLQPHIIPSLFPAPQGLPAHPHTSLIPPLTYPHLSYTNPHLPLHPTTIFPHVVPSHVHLKQPPPLGPSGTPSPSIT